jgi:hypothetical protein
MGIEVVRGEGMQHPSSSLGVCASTGTGGHDAFRAGEFDRPDHGTGGAWTNLSLSDGLRRNRVSICPHFQNICGEKDLPQSQA